MALVKRITNGECRTFSSLRKSTCLSAFYVPLLALSWTFHFYGSIEKHTFVANAEDFSTKFTANTGIVPLQGYNVLSLGTLFDNSNLKASVRKSLTKGMSLEAILDYNPHEDEKALQLSEKIVLSGETNPIHDSKVSVDVTFHFPSNVVGVAGLAKYKNYAVKADYDTKNMLKSLGAASQAVFAQRRLSVEPSHNFTSGRTSLNIAGDVSVPNADNSATASIHAYRDRDGTMDALLMLKYSFNKGRDIFSPTITIKDKNVTYNWEHTFVKGGRLKAKLNEFKKLSLEWFDPLVTSGQWIVKADVPVSEPQQGKISFIREMSF